jgi:hypothetical protein
MLLSASKRFALVASSALTAGEVVFFFFFFYEVEAGIVGNKTS